MFNHVQRNAYSSSLVSLSHNQRISKRLETIGFACFIWWHESTYAAHNGIRHCFILAQIILTTLNRMNRIKMNTHSIWMWTTTKLSYMIINVLKFGFIFLHDATMHKAMHWLPSSNPHPRISLKECLVFFWSMFHPPTIQIIYQLFWLVVWTPLKNISQLVFLFPTEWKIWNSCFKPYTNYSILVQDFLLGSSPKRYTVLNLRASLQPLKNPQSPSNLPILNHSYNIIYIPLNIHIFIIIHYSPSLTIIKHD